MDFATLNTLHQSTPTNMDSLDARMVYQSDATAVAQQGDDKLFVKFYNKPVKDEEKSLAANRSIFRDDVYIHIRIPGDKFNDVNRPAFPEDFQRFPAHYDRFRKNAEQIVGTPLSVLPFLSEGQVLEYAAAFIRTVEQLAGMSDVNCQKMMGSITHKAQAQQFLDRLQGADAIRAEFSDRIAKQDKEMAELREQLAKVTAKSK